MKTFKEYIEESKYDDEGMIKSMTPDRAVKWLEKTAKSIRSHASKGGSIGSARGSELQMRYDDHKEWLKNKSPKHWESYCKKNGCHVDHDAGDLYA